MRFKVVYEIYDYAVYMFSVYYGQTESTFVCFDECQHVWVVSCFCSYIDIFRQ